MELLDFAKVLDKAASEAYAIPQISTSNPITLEEAYQIQKLSLEQRFEKGEKLVGYKMGFTSREKMEQMGVHDLIWGKLTDAMQIENDGFLELNKFVHPRAEPEICFLIKKEIVTTLTLDNVEDYIEAYAAALEIIDSRYEHFSFSLEDVVADNCSSSAFVIGDWKKIDSTRNLSIQVKINEQIIHTGNSKAILGNPLESLVEASRLITDFGETIKKGHIVLAGAATPAEFIKSENHIEAVVEKLGSVKINVK